MCFYKFPCYRQTDATSLVHHGVGDIVLKKALKYFILLRFRNANSVICNLYLQPVGGILRFLNRVNGYINLTILCSELEGIRQKVKQYFLKFILVKKGF